jgi:hypothetical protein
MTLERNSGLPLQTTLLRPDHSISTPIRLRVAFRKAVSYKNDIGSWGYWLSVE